VGLIKTSSEDHQQVQVEGSRPAGQRVLDLCAVPTRKEVHVVEQDRNGLAAGVGLSAIGVQATLSLCWEAPAPAGARHLSYIRLKTEILEGQCPEPASVAQPFPCQAITAVNSSHAATSPGLTPDGKCLNLQAQLTCQRWPKV